MAKDNQDHPTTDFNTDSNSNTNPPFDYNSHENKRKDLNSAVNSFNKQLYQLGITTSEIANSTIDLLSDHWKSNNTDFFYGLGSDDDKTNSKVDNNSSWNPSWRFNPNRFMSRNSEKLKQCEEKQGVNIWDTNAYYHCLLPNSSILLANGKVLTRDEFDANASNPDSENANNSYFTSLNAFQKWNYDMKKLYRKQRLEEWQNQKKRWYGKNEDTKVDAYGDNNTTAIATLDESGATPVSVTLPERKNAEKKIIGNSESISTQSIDGNPGQFEKVTIKTIYYDDGSVDRTENTSIVDDSGLDRNSIFGPFGKFGGFGRFDFNENDNQDRFKEFDDIKAITDSNNSNNDSSSGWFWGKK